jgi:hypothetical protein
MCTIMIITTVFVATVTDRPEPVPGSDTGSPLLLTAYA